MYFLCPYMFIPSAFITNPTLHVRPPLEFFLFEVLRKFQLTMII
jgi:hypothetical protein